MKTTNKKNFRKNQYQILETNEAELYLHVLGNPVHHFFGVFGDYLTKTVLRVNSVVISSQRLDVGGGAANSIPEEALTHYEYTEVSDIKNSVKVNIKIFLISSLKIS